MNKRTRAIAIAAISVIVLGVLIYVWLPESGPKTDTALVEAAAASAREARNAQPAPVDDPKREGRARPGAMGTTP